MNISKIDLYLKHENELCKDVEGNIIYSGDILLPINMITKKKDKYIISYDKLQNPLNYIYLVEYFIDKNENKLKLFHHFGGFSISYGFSPVRRAITKHCVKKVTLKDLNNIILYYVPDTIDKKVIKSKFIDTIYYKQFLKIYKGILYRNNWITKYNNFPYICIDKDPKLFVVYNIYGIPYLNSKHKEYFFKVKNNKLN